MDIGEKNKKTLGLIIPKNVVRLGCMTKLDLDADHVINHAIGKLDQVAIVGWDKDNELYAASSIVNDTETLMLLERFKQVLLG